MSKQPQSQEKAKSAPANSFTPVPTGLLQRKCACGGAASLTGKCGGCEEGQLSFQRQAATHTESSDIPSSVNLALQSYGQPLESSTRSFMESRFGHDFSQVRVHTDAQAMESAGAVNALAYTVGKDIVFGAGQYAPGTQSGQKLLAHELVHTIQQSGSTPQNVSRISQPGDPHEREADQVAEQIMRTNDEAVSDSDHDDHLSRKPVETTADHPGISALHRQAPDEAPQPEATSEEGYEVGGELMMTLPRWQFVTLPATNSGTPAAASLRTLGEPPTLQRQGGGACDVPTSMRAVTSGAFEGGKTMDDYFPDLVGAGFWGSNNTAGPFDTGKRAGSSVQLIGEYPAPCAAGGSNFTLGQTATIVRARADGKKMMEKGKALEGQTLNDIARSGRDASKPPFRQEFSFAVSMADPISGIPYSTLASYEWEVNLTSSLSGPGGTKSVGWGVTVEASAGSVTKNEVR